MGLLKSTIEFKETLEWCRREVDNMCAVAKSIKDPEQRGYMQALCDRVSEAQKAHYNSSTALLDAIDTYLYK